MSPMKINLWFSPFKTVKGERIPRERGDLLLPWQYEIANRLGVCPRC